MQSIRSRIIIWLIKNRHLFKFKLRPEVIDENFSVNEFRENINRVTAKIRMPKGITTQKENISSINAEWIIPENHHAGKVLLYIHGGGFISGSCQTHRMHVAKFAMGSKLKSLVFDYRLAPEHPFPAAVDDTLTAYQWLLEQGYRAQDIIVGGESAGGTLTLALLLALKKQKTSMPKAAFSISPITDLRCLADSFRYNAKNDIAPIGSWDLWANLYIGNHDPKDPLLSPQMGDFTGLPPLHICVGTYEVHYDDCVNLALKAKKHGVDVVLSEWPKMVHAFPILSPLFPEAKNAMTEICEFMQIQLNH